MDRYDQKEKALAIRRQYKYREMILKGQISLPPESARKLIGPDTAYHLYGFEVPEKGDKKG